MKVLKFGGSSIGSPDKINKVIEILKVYLHQKERVAVVFSAVQGVTDQLLSLCRQAVNGDSDYTEALQRLEQQHLDIIKELIPKSKSRDITQKIEEYFGELQKLLYGIYLLRELSDRSVDYIISFGEILSCSIIVEVLNTRKLAAELLDSRFIVKTDSSFGNAKVDFKATNKNIIRHFKKHIKTQIIIGFIGSDADNVTTTLGREGSDYTVAIFGAALNASEIEIWTDVNGILTADPKKVKTAFSIANISYEEAMELSHFGAQVVHPPAIIPALNGKIPVRIRNTFDVTFKGTVIAAKQAGIASKVKGISSVDNITLLKISGGGMIGVAGIASRLLGSLANQNISVILISQSSSEHTICLGVLPKYGVLAKKVIETEFKYEILAGDIKEVSMEQNLSVIAIVGDNLINIAGVSGKAFNALGQNGIAIKAIAQGSSELNISIVISNHGLNKALNVLHDALFLSKVRTVNLFMVGPGSVGKAFIELLNSRMAYMNKELYLNFQMIGLANSKKMVIDPKGINLNAWQTRFKRVCKVSAAHKFVTTMQEMNLPNTVFIDCTAGHAFVPYYHEILCSSISIITPNKIANSNSYQEFLQLQEAVKNYGVQFKYSTNVGAALPIINTLKDLMRNGDQIIKIEGVLSGTLSYIFNSLKEGRGFCEAVKIARDKNYTEPDSRDDLNGLDFARKLLILIRESGERFEMEDIAIESLIPDQACSAASVNDFFKKLQEADNDFQKRIDVAQAKGKVLCYIARYEKGKAKVGIEEIGPEHIFYNLSGNDNIVAFTTYQYSEKPLIIRGAGAGADFTAAGVFADLLRVSNC